MNAIQDATNAELIAKLHSRQEVFAVQDHSDRVVTRSRPTCLVSTARWSSAPPRSHAQGLALTRSVRDGGPSTGGDCACVRRGVAVQSLRLEAAGPLEGTS